MTLNDALRSEGGAPRAVPRWLVAVAVLETASLVVLVTNLLTLDIRPLAAALGSIHGGLYLAIVLGVAALRAGWRGALLALLPAVGGLLAIAFVRRRAAAARTASSPGFGQSDEPATDSAP